MLENNNIHKIQSYDFSIIPLLKEGFNRSQGVKGNFIGAIVIYIIIAFITNAILTIIFPSEESNANGYIASILAIPITLPVVIGITMLGINRAKEQEVVITSIFDYYVKLGTIISAYIMMNFLTTIGFILLIIPGIYLLISYTFTYALIVDKGLGFWEAMELSRKTITKQWFKFFALSMLSGFLIILSSIPFGIGLIWSIPMVYISYGLLYHHLFDEED